MLLNFFRFILTTSLGEYSLLTGLRQNRSSKPCLIRDEQDMALISVAFFKYVQLKDISASKLSKNENKYFLTKKNTLIPIYELLKIMTSREIL